MNNSITIKGMLLLLFGMLITITVVAIGGVALVVSQFKSSTESSIITSSLLKASGDSDMMHDTFRSDFLNALLIAGREDREGEKELRKDFAEHQKIWSEALETLKKTEKTPELAAMVDSLEPRIAGYKSRTVKLIDLAFSDHKAALEAEPAFSKEFADLEAPMAKMSQLIVKLNSDSQSQGAERAASASRWASILGLLTIGAVIAVLVGAIRVVRGQVQLIVETAENLSSGSADLTRRIPMLTGEFGKLSTSMNAFIDLLRGMMVDVSGRATAIATAAKEISAGSTDLSSRTEEQASTLEETASSMEEFSSSIKQTAGNTTSAAGAAKRAIDSARRGRGIVGDSTERMQEILASSKRMSDIIGIIDSIAFQTNILALNAAVEAARAGDSGRGFAVVASEVRALAQRSAASAKDIRGLIATTVESVESGAKRSEEAQVAIDGIVHANEEVLSAITEISTAANEQAQGIDQVSRAIVQLEGVTQQNAALVEQAAAAAESMREQADMLSVLVARFKLGEPMVNGLGAATQATRRVVTARRNTLLATSKPATAPALPNTGDGEWKEF